MQCPNSGRHGSEARNKATKRNHAVRDRGTLPFALLRVAGQTKASVPTQARRGGLGL